MNHGLRHLFRRSLLHRHDALRLHRPLGSLLQPSSSVVAHARASLWTPAPRRLEWSTVVARPGARRLSTSDAPSAPPPSDAHEQWRDSSYIGPRILYSGSYVCQRFQDHLETRTQEGWTPVHESLLELRAPGLMKALTDGHDINASTLNGRTPLHVALNLTPVFPETIQTLIASGADVSLPDANGWTPLHEALAAGVDAKLLELLLQHGASPSAMTATGYTPLSLLVNYRPVPAQVELLVKYGADVNLPIEPHSVTPLQEAIRAGASLDVIQTLLKLGADPKATNVQGDTSLHFAAMANYDNDSRERLIRMLLDAGADLSVTDAYFTPLRVAFLNKFCGLSSIVMLAKANRAAPHPTRSEAQEMLYFAFRFKRSDVVDYALAHGANPSLLNRGGWSLLHHAIREGASVLPLLEAGADPNVPSSKGVTPLNVAVSAVMHPPEVRLEYVTQLLSFGASATMADFAGWSPLHVAIHQGASLEIIEALLRQGKADPNQPNLKKITPILLAFNLNSSHELIEMLFKYGGDAHATSPYGWSALHYACHHGYSESIVKMLLDRGASPNVMNDGGATPLTCLLARPTPSPEVMELLLNAGASPNLSSSWSPILIVAKKRAIPLMKRLLEAGANPNVPLTIGLHSPLSLILLNSTSASEAAEATKVLLEHKADPNQQSLLGRRPLCLVASNPNLDERTLIALLDAGADVNFRGPAGLTPLLEFLQSQHPLKREFVKILLSRGADVKSARYGKSCVHFALDNRVSMDIVRDLFEAGAWIPHTLMRYAISHAAQQSPPGDPTEAVKLILEFGATEPQRREALTCALQHNSPAATIQALSTEKTPGASASPASVDSAASSAVSEVIPRLSLASGAEATTRDAVRLIAAMRSATSAETFAGLVESLVSCGQVKFATRNGWTALHAAVSNPVSDSTIVKRLLEAGADPNAKSVFGMSPLLGTIMYQQSSKMREIIKELLNAGVDLHVEDQRGRSVLECALARRGMDVEVIRDFLEAGALPNRPRLIFRVLRHALSATPPEDPTEMIRLLVKHGASFHSSDGTLSYAQARGAPASTIEVLQEAAAREQQLAAETSESGADAAGSEGGEDEATFRKPTLLHLHLRRNPKDASGLASLVARGEDPNKRDQIGWTPLQLAMHNPETVPEVVEALLKLGADPNQLSSSGLAPIITAIVCTSPHRDTYVKLLLKHGADPNVTDNRKISSLTYALMREPSVEMIRSMLEAGAKIETEFPNQTMQRAIMHNVSVDVIKLLLAHGASPREPNGGNPRDGPWWVAKWHGSSPETLEVLREALYPNGMSPSGIKSTLAKHHLRRSGEAQPATARGFRKSAAGAPAFHASSKPSFKPKPGAPAPARKWAAWRPKATEPVLKSEATSNPVFQAGAAPKGAAKPRGGKPKAATSKESANAAPEASPAGNRGAVNFDPSRAGFVPPNSVYDRE